MSAAEQIIPAEHPQRKLEVLPDAMYSVRDVAEILDFESRPGTIYDIPEAELVPTWVGPRRGKKMFRGRDILRYIDAGRPRTAPKLYDPTAS